MLARKHFGAVWSLLMIFTPLKETDPRLRQVCAKLTRKDLRSRLQQLEIDALLEFVAGKHDTDAAKGRGRRASTVGLSANQVGIMKQICVVDLAVGCKGYNDLYVLINPRVVRHSKLTVARSEGCVNFPTTWGMARRSRSVRVVALDRSGNELELRLTGWPAALVQHEIDHLYGRLFIDRLADPVKAHHVEPDEYEIYRRSKPGEWGNFVDVSVHAVSLPELYQPTMDDHRQTIG